MFLRSLAIHNDKKLVREIIFHKGINLIVDETTIGKITESGNSVGKTTVLRLIDFCLDGKGENIYVDPEFKTTNATVEKFLKKNNIIVSLALANDLNNKLSNDIIIKRNFLKRKEKIQTINDITYTNPDFSKELKKIVFKTSSDKPTFKQLKSKNIRDEKNKLINTIRVLAPNVVTDVVYEALHLFWFGIDVDLSKDKLVRDKNIEEKLQARLRKESNLPQINQSLTLINKELEKLEVKKDNFNLNEKYEKDLETLNRTKSKINTLGVEISRLQLRKELIIESKLDLEKNIATIDTKQIESLYKKAKSFIPNIQKTFEETLDFHNDIIQKKKYFIGEELPSLEQDISKKNHRLDSLLAEEKQLSELLSKAGAIEDLQVVIDELNLFHERKGAFEEKKSLWEKSNDNLKEISERLDEINHEIYSKDDLIQQRIEEFNIFFSDISNRLDGVHSLLSAENPDGVYKFIIGNIEGNPGTGSKKSQMASFDLAYIKFADSLNIPCFHFILQDQIENVHSNQITSLLTQIVSEVNCQYVLPVLRDKLPDDIDTSQFEILSLSQQEKLFKI